MPRLSLHIFNTKMDTKVAKLVKEVVSVNGLSTVVSKILPQNYIQKHVIVLIPGNPGLVEFYDVFITTLFDSLRGEYPLYAISHAGKCNLEACVRKFCFTDKNRIAEW